MKLFERAVRRAEVPIRMSEGFNPRPKISFPLALALGVEGLDEVVEMELNEWVPTAILIERLSRQLPQGIEIAILELVSPSESSQVEEVTYRIKLVPYNDTGLDGNGVLQARIDELIQKKDVLVCREKDGKKKNFNIRPSIIDIVAGTNFLELRLRVTAEGMARPEEVITSLGLDKEIDYRLLEIARTKVELGHR